MDSLEDAKKSKSPPARPPPPAKVDSSDILDLQDERTPPKHQSSFGNLEIPLSVQKHLDELRALQKHRVRWFYKEGKKWVPFNGRDSLVIEEEWLALHNQDPDSDIEKCYAPTVRGRLYEVDIKERVCCPLYWKEYSEPTKIMRGTWFKGSSSNENWEPIDEHDAEKIEVGHQGVVRSLGVGSVEMKNSEQTVMEVLKLAHGYRVEWRDINDIRMVHQGTGSLLAKSIGIGGSSKLVRGWHTDATVIDDLPEINHIIFLIHGIGQLMYQTGGIIHSAQKLRDATNKVIERHFKDTFKDGRVEFLPVEWRSSLKLDEGLVQAITPNKAGGLRKIINETTMDIMYYTSSFFRNEIKKSLREQLNLIYSKFINRNPDFLTRGGKISVISHSLGSVIFHDILINWNDQLIDEHKQQADKNIATEGRWSWIWGSRRRKQPSESIDETAQQSDEYSALQERLRQAKEDVADLEAKLFAGKSTANTDTQCSERGHDFSLGFKIENAFNIGSPLGVFLVLKGIRPRDDLEQHILPTSVCSRYYNIYHPADPIAYRIEPLIYEHYSEIPPVQINRATRLSEKEIEDEGVKVESSAAGWLKSLWGMASKSPPMVAEYHADGQVQLPKGECEKTDTILKERKG